MYAGTIVIRKHITTGAARWYVIAEARPPVAEPVSDRSIVGTPRLGRMQVRGKVPW